MTEIFLVEKLSNYKRIKVGTEKVIKSLFLTIYENMDFDKKMQYIRSSFNRNIRGLEGIHEMGEVKIKLSSKFDGTEEILDCDCVAITSAGGNLEYSWGVENDSFVGYLFMFDVGYIEVIYKNYWKSSDIGSLFRPVSSKIVLGEEFFKGFFKETPFRNIRIEKFLNEHSLYEYIRYENPIFLEFIIGLENDVSSDNCH